MAIDFGDVRVDEQGRRYVLDKATGQKYLVREKHERNGTVVEYAKQFAEFTPPRPHALRAYNDNVNKRKRQLTYPPPPVTTPPPQGDRQGALKLIERERAVGRVQLRHMMAPPLARATFIPGSEPDDARQNSQ